MRPLATLALVLVVLAVLSSRPAPPHDAPLEPRALVALVGMLLALVLSRYLFTFRRARFIRVATVAASLAPLVALAFGLTPSVIAAGASVVWLVASDAVLDTVALARSDATLRIRAAATVAMLFVVGSSWAAVMTVLALVVLVPALSRVAHTSVALAPGETEVSLLTRDGLALRGTLDARGAATPVLIVHGHADARSRFAPWAHVLHRAGHPVLSLDHRAHGRSSGAVCTLTDREADDTMRFAQLLLTRTHRSRLALLATSLGSGAALRAAHRLGPSRVSGVVALAPALDFGEITRSSGLVGPMFALGDTTLRALGLPPFDALAPRHDYPTGIPVLIVHSRSDHTIPFALAARVARNRHAELLALDDVSHEAMPHEALARPAVRRRVLAVLAAP